MRLSAMAQRVVYRRYEVIKLTPSER